MLGQVPLPDDLAVLRQLRDSLTHERRAVVEKMQGGLSQGMQIQWLPD